MTTPTRSGRIHSLEAHPQPQSQGEQRLRLLCADWLLSFRCSAEVLHQALVDANTGARPLPDHPLREGDLVRLYLADAHEHPCDEESRSGNDARREDTSGNKSQREDVSQEDTTEARVSKLVLCGRGQLKEAGDAWRWRRQKPSRMAYLKARQRLFSALRSWFETEGFLEVDTPALVPAPTPDLELQPFAVHAPTEPASRPNYLITSPELQMKRLLVGGFEKIYRLGAVYRAGEWGATHHPEFTMLEWYRSHADVEAPRLETPRLEAPRLETLCDDVEALFGVAADLAEELLAEGMLAEQSTISRRLIEGWRQRPYRRQTVAALFDDLLGLDIDGVTTVEGLCEVLQRSGWESWLRRQKKNQDERNSSLSFAALFAALWERLEQRLDTSSRPLFVHRWPAPLASLAQLDPQDARYALRIECYSGGLELANGFVELTDAAEQRRRFRTESQRRAAKGLPSLPLDGRFLEALEEGMPPAVGLALGFDRLLMLISGAKTMRQVLPFAWDER